ncbi:MAG: hypothetical protein ACI9MC_003748 [Kiritimatiellia bacterium]
MPFPRHALDLGVVRATLTGFDAASHEWINTDYADMRCIPSRPKARGEHDGGAFLKSRMVSRSGAPPQGHGQHAPCQTR